MNIQISNKKIGEFFSTFVVAEVGINHNGNLKTAKEMIIKAKEIGADAVKFQTFRADDIATKNSKYYKIFKKYELEENTFRELSDVAKNNSIIFFSTAASKDACDFLTELRVPAFKISSGNLTNLQLLEYVASKKKPIIISTGMASQKEVDIAVKTIENSKNNKIIIMHSVSAYPTPLEHYNLNVIPTFKMRYSYPIGFSDNGPDKLAPLIAVAKGAKMIEKHFTLSKKSRGPDHLISMNPQEFKEMIVNIRNVEKILGDDKKKCQPSELENKTQARRSIVSVIKIPKNMKITSDMLAIKRPGTGIEPKHLTKLIGKKSTRTIPADVPLKWKYFN